MGTRVHDSKSMIFSTVYSEYVYSWLEKEKKNDASGYCVHIFILIVNISLNICSYLSFLCFLFFLLLSLIFIIQDSIKVDTLHLTVILGHEHPLRYSYLDNPMDRGAWRATVHRVAKSWKQLKWQHTHTHIAVLPLKKLINWWLHWVLVVAHGLSCPKAYRILAPQPWIEPMLPALEGSFLTAGPPGKSLSVQSLSCVQLFATLWIAARQASLFITNSHS